MIFRRVDPLPRSRFRTTREIPVRVTPIPSQFMGVSTSPSISQLIRAVMAPTKTLAVRIVRVRRGMSGSVVERVGRVKSTVTGMVKTLERYGYIRRFRSTEDQRVVYIALTERGHALQGDFEAISGLLLAQVYGKMPQEERKTLVCLLAVIEHNLQHNARSG